MFHRTSFFLVRSLFAASVFVSLVACGVETTGSEPQGEHTSNSDKAAAKKQHDGGGADASIEPASDGGVFGADASCDCNDGSDASAGDYDGGVYEGDSGTDDGEDGGAYGDDDDSADAGAYGADASVPWPWR